jgi:hypothetical protein
MDDESQKGGSQMARTLWRVAVSRIAFKDRTLILNYGGWIDLPPDQEFTLKAGEENQITSNVKVTISGSIEATLVSPAALIVYTDDGGKCAEPILPSGTTIRFKEKQVTLAPDRSKTEIKTGTKIITPGQRVPNISPEPINKILGNDSDAIDFWLPAAGELTIDEGDAWIRFVPEDGLKRLGISN